MQEQETRINHSFSTDLGKSAVILFVLVSFGTKRKRERAREKGRGEREKGQALLLDRLRASKEEERERMASKWS